MFGFGENVLSQFVRDRAAVEAHLVRLNPPALLMMDDHDWSIRMKRRLPDCWVIHRAYREDDHEMHHKMSAADIWAAHRNYAAEGVIVQVWNEPDGYNNLSAFSTKAAEVIRLAAGEGKRVALPNWAVGHPDEAAINRGEADALIRAFYDFPQMPICFHEYAQFNPTAEQSYRVGRYRTFLARARAIGKPLNPARIVLTETGRDVGGAVNDGWRNVFTPAQYAVFLRTLAGIYHADGLRAILPFCIGRGGDMPDGSGGRWRNFDHEGESVVYTTMEDWNRDHPMTVTTPVYTLPAAGDPRWRECTVASTGGTTYLRRTPYVINGAGSNAAGWITTSPSKAWIIVEAAVKMSDGTWIPIKTPSGLIAWVRSDVVKYTLVPTVSDKLVEALYVSQWTKPDGTYWPSRRTGMCGPAAVWSALTWDRIAERGVALPPEITVDSIADFIGLKGSHFSGMAQLVRALAGYGVKAQTTLNLTMQRIKAEIDAKRPCIALIDYRHILGRRDQKFLLGHIVLVVGYNPQSGEIIMHDPDYLRADGHWIRVPGDQFAKALTDTTFSGNAPTQGIIFTEG